MITVISTTSGDYIKKERDITLDDMKVEKVLPQSQDKDNFDQKKYLYGGIKFEFVTDELVKFSEEHSWMHHWDLKTIQGTLFEYSDYVSYQGCRSQVSRFERYNRVVAEVFEKIENHYDDLVEKGLKDLNEKLDKFIDGINECTRKEAVCRYGSIGAYDGEWLQSLSNQDDIQELADIENQISELEKKAFELKQKIYVDRLPKLASFIRNSDGEHFPVEFVEDVIDSLEQKKVYTGLRLRF